MCDEIEFKRRVKVSQEVVKWRTGTTKADFDANQKILRSMQVCLHTIVEEQGIALLLFGPFAPPPRVFSSSGREIKPRSSKRVRFPDAI